MEWKNIDSAPKDGTRILVYQRGFIGVARYDIDKYAARPKPFWSGHFALIYGVREAKANAPTHWMPLPEAPKD